MIIEDISRDPGNRSKVSVYTDDESIDPIGSCIGQRGSRIMTIIEELGGEKIDVIQYNKNAKEYIKQALSPAKISAVETNEQTKEAIATVAPDQFSLAIGRGGQNVRLAANLTGWTIKVLQAGESEVAVTSDEAPEEVAEKLGEASEEGKEKIEETAESDKKEE